MLNLTVKVWVFIPSSKVSRFVSSFKIPYPYMYTLNRLYFAKCFNTQEEVDKFIKRFKNYHVEYEVIKH